MNAVRTILGVTVRTPAKVNLELRVGPREDHGYHGLSTVFYAVDLTDNVTVSESDTWGCTVVGPYADQVPTDASNLAVQAAQLVYERYGFTGAAHLTIDKAIPVAGGMAGGSADGAAGLVGVDALLDAGLSKQDLHDLAAHLGSDVPFALFGGTALGSGRGEQLAPILTQGRTEWVFALRHQGLSTPAVYAECDRMRGDDPVPPPEPSQELMAALRAGDVTSLAGCLHNDLQPAACSLLPELEETLQVGHDNGALRGIVSGSGPTVAFLCQDKAAALELMVALTASKTCDEVVRASGPAHGAHVVHDVRMT